jgi:hypothetical protein
MIYFALEFTVNQEETQQRESITADVFGRKSTTCRERQSNSDGRSDGNSVRRTADQTIKQNNKQQNFAFIYYFFPEKSSLFCKTQIIQIFHLVPYS